MPPLTKRAVTASALLATLLGVAFLLVGCTSMSKATLRTELSALDKNAALVELGLETRALELGGEDGPQPFELLFAHAPARDPRPGGAPVVLVHGTPGTLFNWGEVMLGSADGFPGLAEGRDVYALEVLGHGLAPGDPEAGGAFGFQKAADFVAAAVEALELPPVHLVGQSYGAEFAWRAALDRPDLFASVTLTSASGYARTDEEFFPEELEMRDNALADYGWLINAPDRVETALAPHFRELPPDRVQEFFLVCENAANWRSMIDLVRDENGARSAELPGLDLPVLLLWGAEDLAFPVATIAARFQADLPRAELATVEAGHYPHEERPGDYGRALEAFLDRTEASR